MGALHRSTANVERRADELIDRERLGSNGRANNVDDCVGGSDLVKVNLLQRNVVNLGFSGAECKKDLAGQLLHAFTQRSGIDDLQNIVQMPAMRMLVSMIRRSVIMLVGMLMLMAVRMRMPRLAAGSRE